MIHHRYRRRRSVLILSFRFVLPPLVLVSDANPPPPPLFSLFLCFIITIKTNSFSVLTPSFLTKLYHPHPHPHKSHTPSLSLSLGESKQVLLLDLNFQFSIFFFFNADYCFVIYFMSFVNCVRQIDDWGAEQSTCIHLDR